MHRHRWLAAFCMALTLLSQSGCCCCVSIPTGPEDGEFGEFGDFAPPEGFDEEGEDEMEAPEANEELEDEGG